MRWPPEHPALHDRVLGPLTDSATDLCVDGHLGAVLRHVPGRRIAIAVDTPAGPGVLKIFSTPRARGNHRRLTMLDHTPARGHVPRSWGCDPTGHVGLVAWQPGETLHELPDERWVNGCFAAGAALASLHRSGAQLDRAWTSTNELVQLRRATAGPEQGLVVRAEAVCDRLADAPLVSAHRDFHPKQVVVADGQAALIDLDDAAQAPSGLDVGNFLAHLAQEAVIGHRTAGVVAAARDGFLDAYGGTDEDRDAWEWLALVRLAGLALTRHGRMDWCRALCSHATQEVPA